MKTEEAEIVIIGAGIIGSSLAYHLALLGKRNIVVLEKSGITHGATWHAAGLVGQLRSSRNTTRMLKYSVELYNKIAKETDNSIDWRQVGSLRLSCSPERDLENKRLLTMARSFGLDMEWLNPDQAQTLFPLMSKKDVRSAIYIPTDGYVDPTSLCNALAKAARDLGVKFVIGQRVGGFKYERERITHVETQDTSWQCEIAVNATGMWGNELGNLANARIPAFALEHQYLITEPIPNCPQNMPTLRDPDHLVYYKQEVSGLAIGGYEDNTIAFAPNGIPKTFGQELLADNFDRFEVLAQNAGKRTPAVNEVGVRKMINGPIPYSADGDFVMGQVPGYDNLFVASGFLYGIAAGGGAGKMMAEWIVDGAPSLNLWPLDVKRFNFHHSTKYYMYPRAVELYGKHYKMRWPEDQHESCRKLRRSPLFSTLEAQGACSGSRAGWERPNWFAPTPAMAFDEPSFIRKQTNFYPYVAAEHLAVREGVALIDQSSFSKFELVGPDSLRLLQKLSTCDMDKKIGSTIYSQFCNSKGGVECDLTISRLEDDRFYVVTGSSFGVHDGEWIRKHIRDEKLNCYLHEATSARAVINICGPKSRDVLQKIVEENVTNEAFPFSSCREITIGAAPVLAIRIGFVGELGWELHIPTEFAGHVFELLQEAGREFGIKNVGYRAIDSLRLEKRYLYWSTDVTPDTTPFEVGLGYKVDFKKSDFIGRQALLEQSEKGIRKKLHCLSIDGELSAYGSEAIYADGKAIGATTSGNYCHTVKKTLVFALISVDVSLKSSFEVEILGERHLATVVKGAAYDPKNIRLKG